MKRTTLISSLSRIPGRHPRRFLEASQDECEQARLELRVPATRMTEIVHGRRGITAEQPCG